MNYECSFCQAKTDRIEDGWGYAKLQTPSGNTEVTFCPKHRKEAEAKLDVIFDLPQAIPKAAK